MAIGTDRVQVIKVESAANGGTAGDAEPWNYDPINPQQDAIESCGGYVQDGSNRDQTVYYDRSGADFRFRDQNNTTPLTLSQLRSGTASHSLFDNAGGLVYTGAGIIVTAGA